MMRALSLGSLLLLLAAALGGCRARLTVADISEVGNYGVIDGLPFRVRETYTLRVLQYRKSKDPEAADPAEFVEVYTKKVALANPHRLYALNTRSEAFADGDLVVDYLPDGTLKIVSLQETRDLEGAKGAVTSLGQVVKDAMSIDESIRTRETELRAAQDAEREAEVNSWAELATLEANREKLRLTWARYRAAIDRKDAEEALALGSEMRGLMVEINKSMIKLRGAPQWPNIYAVNLYELFE